MTPARKEARQLVYTALTTPGLPDGVNAAYDHEPDHRVDGPVMVVVEVGGTTAEDVTVAVEVVTFASAAASGHKQGHDAAADLHDDAVTAVEERLAPAFGADVWVDRLDRVGDGPTATAQYVSRCEIAVPRSDLFGA